MKNPSFKLRLLKWSLTLAGLIILVTLSAILIYGWYLASRIEDRFAARRWSIPSKVFADSTLVYPGQTINRELFREKLRGLGYREVSGRPAHGGEIHTTDSSITIFLNDLKGISGVRRGFPVRIRFRDDKIRSIQRLDRQESLALLEVEPEEIMLFFGPEREQRRLVSIDQVPAHLIHAVLAAEDARFYQHHGVDPRGILRALYINLRSWGIRQGGSTITQQLAKNYFLTPKRTLERKAKEFLMALIMEVMYEKNEILEIYLNEIYLGQKGSISVNGVGEAAQFYFGKSIHDISLPEAAAMAGLIKGPNYYSPYVSKERCRRRRDTVLQQMRSAGWIDAAELDQALTTPVIPAGYTRHGRKAPYFIDYLCEQLAQLYPPEILTSLGLSIYTTLDTQVQMAAEKALIAGLRRLEHDNPALRRDDPAQKLQGAVIVLQPKTGYILAMVGGRDYSVSQFNRATQARRQSGSTFKPFVYLCGLKRFSPTSQLNNSPRSYIVNGKPWSPRNYKPDTLTHVSLKTALARSLNLATIDLAMQVGLKRIARTAQKFGFSTPLEPYPSLALGAFEVIPLELARAYCCFAADGVQPFLLSMKEVVDEHGQHLERRHMKIERLISPAKAFMMSHLLSQVVKEGTAQALNRMGISFPVAGKTGTTNDYRDAWFIGYTPDILALIWIGFDDGTPINASGASAALPIWADLIKAIPQYISRSPFRMPAGIVTRRICPESGQLAVKGRCPAPREEVFLAENAPYKLCPLHRKIDPLQKVFEGFESFIKRF